jgi:hypothetical protein
LFLVFRVNFDSDPNPNIFGFGSRSKRSRIRVRIGLKNRIGIRIRKKIVRIPNTGGKLSIFKIVSHLSCFAESTIPVPYGRNLKTSGQCFGSGSVRIRIKFATLNPDPHSICGFQLRIRYGDSGSGSRMSILLRSHADLDPKQCLIPLSYNFFVYWFYFL